MRYLARFIKRGQFVAAVRRSSSQVKLRFHFTSVALRVSAHHHRWQGCQVARPLLPLCVSFHSIYSSIAGSHVNWFLPAWLGSCVRYHFASILGVGTLHPSFVPCDGLREPSTLGLLLRAAGQGRGRPPAREGLGAAGPADVTGRKRGQSQLKAGRKSGKTLEKGKSC